MRNRISAAACLLVCVIGVISLAEYLTGWNAGIDNLLFRPGPEDSVGSIRPALMAAVTALSFVFLGLSVWLINLRRPIFVWCSQALTCAAFVTAMFGVLDPVLDLRTTHTHISPLTPVMLVMSSIAVLFSRPDLGLGALIASSTSGGTLARRILPAAVLMPIALGYLRWHAARAGIFSEWLGVSLMIMTVLVSLAIVILWTAFMLNGAEQKRLREQENSARLASIVNSSNEAIIGKTLDGTIISWNPAAEVMYGYTAEEMAGHSIATVVPPDRTQEFEEVLDRLRHGEPVRHFESERIRKNGQRFPVSIAVAPIRDAAGKLTGAATVARDITEEKEAEQKLRRQAALLDLANDAILVRDMQSRVVYWNRGAEKTYGYSSQEALGKVTHQLLRTEFPQSLEEIESCIRENKEWEGEIFHYTRQGTRISVASRWSLMCDANGGPTAILEINRDITERKRAEAALLAEREKFNTILDSVPPYVCLLTTDYHVAFANREFKKRFGEAPGLHCYEALFNRTEPCEICETYKVLKDGQSRRWEWTGPDGRNYDVYDLPFTDTDGSKLILEMGMDVTEQRQAQNALRQSTEELKEAQRVAQLGSWTTDVKTGEVHWSEELYNMLGLDPSRPAVAYSQQERIFTPESWTKLTAHVAQTVRTGVPYELELQTVRSDGSHGWMLARGEPVRDANGTITGLRGVAQDIDKRKQAELALRESEQKFATLADFVPQFVWMCTPDGLNFYFNQRWFDYTGLAPEESYGKGWNTPFHPDDKQAAWNAWNHAVATAETYRVESRLRAADGTYRWFLMRGMPQKDEAGSIARWFGTCTDIDDFKKAEQEIQNLNRELEERVRNRTAELQTILDTAPIGLAISNDPEARHIHGNREIERMLGGSPGGELSKAAPNSPPYRLFSNGRELAADELPMQRAVCGVPVIGESMDVLRPDGTRITILGSAAPLFDEQQRVRGVVGTFVDITDQKRSERELRERTEELRQNQERLIESEQRVRKKLDAILSPEGDLGKLELADILDVPALQSLLDDFYRVFGGTVGVIDLRGKVLAVCGWQRICQQFHRVNPTSCKNCIESDVQLSAGVPAGEFKIYRCRNNMWDVATPIMIGGQHMGNLYCGQFFFADETVDHDVFRAQARKCGFDEQDYLAALDEVPRLSRETVNKSMGFLAKLAQAISQLSYSRVKLARSAAQISGVNAELAVANQELEAFSYSVSHDLRAPLRHISGFSKILSEEFGSQLPEEAQRHLQRIQDGTRRMGQLIDDLLNLSRVGRRELQRQATSLENVVRQVLSDLQVECEGRNVKWNIAPLPFVDCDGALLKQVFQNLLSNALKFTRPRKQAVIEIGCEQEEGVPVIFVRDNGVGFNMKYASKLFGVFQRMHRAEDFEGTGVGLATVQRIVQKHGGRVWAEAELDKGATFYFTLAPLDKTHQESAPQEEVAHALAGN